MRDAVTSDPDFRAWLNGLKIPNFLDKDVLLAAGVIADDEDWQLWLAKGWYAFMMRPVVTDAQQVALFVLVRAELQAEVTCRSPLIAAGTEITCPGGHRVGMATVDIFGPSMSGGVSGDILRAAMIDLDDDQPPLLDARPSEGLPGSEMRCRCGAPWGWFGSLLTADGWRPPLSDAAEASLRTFMAVPA